MIKSVYLGYLNGVDETLGWRWYLRYHSQEVIRFFGPWLRRYETFKAIPPPPEANKYGAVGGYLTELWYSNVEDFIEAKTLERPCTFPDEFRKLKPTEFTAAVTMVPAMPTNDFLGKEPTPEQCNILRWYRAFKYPEGVSIKEGEKWYLEVHSQEVKQQPGLLRYISHKVPEKPPVVTPWIRTEELWYEDLTAWRKANINDPPKYTPPSWKVKEPFVDIASVFIRYKPDVDFLKDHPLIP